jgi:hypothetical protein
MPVKITASFNSGKWTDTSSSKPMRPRSMHCIAATDVASLVADAMQKVVDSDIGLVSDFRLAFPKY